MDLEIFGPRSSAFFIGVHLIAIGCARTPSSHFSALVVLLYFVVVQSFCSSIYSRRTPWPSGLWPLSRISPESVSKHVFHAIKNTTRDCNPSLSCKKCSSVKQIVWYFGKTICRRIFPRKSTPDRHSRLDRYRRSWDKTSNPQNRVRRFFLVVKSDKNDWNELLMPKFIYL